MPTCEGQSNVRLMTEAEREAVEQGLFLAEDHIEIGDYTE